MTTVLLGTTMRERSERKSPIMDYILPPGGWPSRHATRSTAEMPPSFPGRHRHTVSQNRPGEEASPLPSQSPRTACSFTDHSAPSAPHILVIDDSPTVRRIMEVCHRRAGFTVKAFGDGVEALQWLSYAHAALPPLIYLDIEMPRMDGYEVARVLHARPDFARTALLLLSGRDKVTDRLKGRLVGAKAYLTKPFREQDILAQTHFYLPPVTSPSVEW